MVRLAIKFLPVQPNKWLNTSSVQIQETSGATG